MGLRALCVWLCVQEETESTKTRLSSATALVAALANERRDWEFQSQQYQVSPDFRRKCSPFRPPCLTVEAAMLDG